MDDLQAAVLVSLDPFADSSLREKALKYCLEVRTSPNGWVFVLQGISLSMRPEVTFWCLQVVNELLSDSTRYPSSLSTDQIVQLRTTVLQYLACTSFPDRFAQENIAVAKALPSFLLNKLAQVIAALIAADYPHAWPAAFHECVLPLVTSTNASDDSVDGKHSSIAMFFKILRAIDEDVTSIRASQLSEAHRVRSVRVKDAMRDDCVVRIVNICADLLRHPKYACHALNIVGRYVEWVDIRLIANENFLSPIYESITSKDACSWRGAAAAALRAIVLKRMAPGLKGKMLRSLNVDKLLGSLCADTILSNDDGSVDSGLDLQCGQVEVAALVNTMAMISLDIIKTVWKQRGNGNIMDVDAELMTYLYSVARQALLVALQILDENTDDGTGAQTLECVTTYVNVFGQSPGSGDMVSNHENVSLVGAILTAVEERGRFPSDLDPSDQNSERGRAFSELRQALIKRVFSNVARLFTDICVEFVKRLYAHATDSRDSARIELSLAMISILISVVLEHPSVQQVCVFVLLRPPISMNSVLSYVESSSVDVESQRKAEIHLLELISATFFEIVGRSVKVMVTHPNGSLLSSVLTVIFDGRGLSHMSSDVIRSKAAQALVKISKPLRGIMSSGHIGEIIRAASQHLFPVTDDIDSQKWKNQMLMFETVGYLLGTAQKREGSVHLVHAVLKPIVDGVISTTEMGCVAYIAAAGYFSKGFGGDLKIMSLEIEGDGETSERSSKVVIKSEKGLMMSKEMRSVWVECAKTILTNSEVCLTGNGEKWVKEMRLKVLFFLHRMVETIGEAIIWYLEKLLPELLKWCRSAAELHEVISLLCQSTIKFRESLENVTNKVDTLVVARVQQMSYQIDEQTKMAVSEADREVLDVLRMFMYWLNAIVSCGVMDTWWRIAEKQELLNTALKMIIQNAIGNLLDVRVASSVMRMAWQTLGEMVERWGNKNKLVSKEFDKFMLQQVSEASVACGLRSTLFRDGDFSSGQANAVLAEVVRVQSICAQRYGQTFFETLYNAVGGRVTQDDWAVYLSDLTRKSATLPFGEAVQRWALMIRHLRSEYVHNRN